MTQPSPDPSASRETKTPIPVISSKDLFAENKEIHIAHQGETYRLRITSRGKLILQK